MSRNGRDIEDRAFKLACATVTFCNGGWKGGGIQARLLSHLADVSTSVGANLEEASAGQTKPDFISKVANAHKAARQTRYWLRLVATCFPQHHPSIAPLLSETTEIVSILSAIVRKARSNPNRGFEEPADE
jgi:four helix bundle protein